MFRYSRCGWFFTSAALASCRDSWDATVSLTLKHPILVLLEKCGTREHFQQILAQMMRVHLISQTFPMSRLLQYSAVSHPENLNTAILLFNHFTPKPNLYIYNTMISALTFSSGQSITCYKSMLRSCIYPDEHTLLALLKYPKCFSEGKHIHAHAITTGLWSHTYLQNSLIKMYSENGKIDLARAVFQLMPMQDAISCNIMITGYARNGYSLEALELFHDLVVSGFKPDHYTIVGLLMCCGHLKEAFQGKSIHAWMLRRESVGDWGLILCNVLLDMYTKCEEMKLALRVFEGLEERDTVSWNTIIIGFANNGGLDLACRLFDEMPNRDLVSWNSLLSGYSRNGSWKSVRKLFEDMLAENVRPDKVTIVTLICAAAETGFLNQGRWIHGWAFRNQIKLDAFLGSALIDMYCKCGSIERALVVFNRVSERDVAVWTAKISGFAFHGHGIKALELFQNMQEEGLTPNPITLIAVLTACSHAGLVDHGCMIFEGMKENYGIEPGVEHYGCLVDLLTRSGRLIEAENVIKKMPMTPSRSIWGAMLSACKAQGNLELAEAAYKELLKLEPEEEGGFVLLSNAYAANRKWTHSDNVRESMENRGVKKMSGCSIVVVDGVVHEFVSSDKRHPLWEMIYSVLSNLDTEMKSGSAMSFNLLRHFLGQDVCGGI